MQDFCNVESICVSSVVCFASYFNNMDPVVIPDEVNGLAKVMPKRAFADSLL